MLKFSIASAATIAFSGVAQAQGISIPDFLKSGTEKTYTPHCLVRGPSSEYAQANSFANETIGTVTIVSETRKRLFRPAIKVHFVETQIVGQAAIRSANFEMLEEAQGSADDSCQNLADRHKGSNLIFAR